MNTKKLNITGPDMRTFNIMLNYLYQTSKHFVNDERKALLGMNALNQTNLWKFGITGDLPIILVEINQTESTKFVEEILKAFNMDISSLDSAYGWLKSEGFIFILLLLYHSVLLGFS